MKVVCPSCGTTVPGADIDVSSGRAVCRPCGEVILLAFANEQEGQRYLRDLPEELRELQKILERAENDGLCKLVVRTNVTLRELLDTCTEYWDRVAILHYGGHAGGDRLPTDQPGTHTLTATATNELGLTATDTVTYEVGPGCFADGVRLASVQPRGAKVKLLGAADPSSAGRQARILRAGKRAGTATVTGDGRIEATVSAPKSKRLRPGTRYRLVVGGSRSNPMKPSGAVRVLSRKPLPDADLIKGKLAGVRKQGRFTLRARPLCGGPATSRQVSFNRSGVFSVRIGFTSATRTFSIRRSGGEVPLPVVMPAARFITGN